MTSSSVSQWENITYIFCLWMSKVSTNEKRCYICNIFSQWLGPCSTIDWRQAQCISDQIMSMITWCALDFGNSSTLLWIHKYNAGDPPMTSQKRTYNEYELQHISFGVASLSWHGVGLLSQLPPFSYFPIFSWGRKHQLPIEYLIHIWQVSLQLSCTTTGKTHVKCVLQELTAT